MGEVVNMSASRELTREEGLLADGVSLEYICNEYRSVSVHEISVGPTVECWCVFDFGDAGTGDGKSYAAVTLKSPSVFTSGLYFTMFMAEYTDPDFLDNKDAVANMIIDWLKPLHSDQNIVREC